MAQGKSKELIAPCKRHFQTTERFWQRSYSISCNNCWIRSSVNSRARNLMNAPRDVVVTVTAVISGAEQAPWNYRFRVIVTAGFRRICFDVGNAAKRLSPRPWWKLYCKGPDKSFPGASWLRDVYAAQDGKQARERLSRLVDRLCEPYPELAIQNRPPSVQPFRGHVPAARDVFHTHRSNRIDRWRKIPRYGYDIYWSNS